MKQQVLARKIGVFIFTALLLIHVIHGVADAQELKFIDGETTTREIAENAAVGTNVGAPLQFSNNACRRFRLLGPDAGSFKFVRVYRGVQLKTRSTFDYEAFAGEPRAYFINVHASDGAMSDSFLDLAVHKTVDGNSVQAQLQRLRDHSDGSLKDQRVIALLESVLASMQPDKTVLLSNYPNPFNPETWIPYRLAKAADVQITVYNAHGTVVRHLELGHQSVGYYTSRGRAAYWNGCNDFGERVASGVYFYQLQADTVSPLRKMVILK